MYALEIEILLNRFLCSAKLAGLLDGQKEQNTGAEDRARRTEKEKQRQEYVREGVRRLLDWERRINGGTAHDQLRDRRD